MDTQKTARSIRKRIMLCLLVLLLAAAPAVLVNRSAIRAFIKDMPLIRESLRRRTAEEQVQVYGRQARARLAPKFDAVQVSYPPHRVAMVAIKDSRQLQVYAADDAKPYRYVCSYPILGASGTLGPKLREGDMQVPEGIYQVTLEPNTPYHLALRLNYPNEFDLMHAAEDGRNPGSDILIHGTEGSIGCLAMGDPASEDLFVLVYDTKARTAPLVIAPADLRVSDAPARKPTDPEWLPDL